MQETWVQSLDQEDTLEKEMATHSSILAWRIIYTEEPTRLQSMGLQSQTWVTNTFTFFFPHKLSIDSYTFSIVLLLQVITVFIYLSHVCLSN